MKRALALLLLAAPAPVLADQVHLKGGRVITGVVVERTPRGVTLEVGPGRLTLPASEVERVVASESALQAFRARAAALAAGDLRGWLELAVWAQDHGLLTQAREVYEHVLDLDPANAEAHGGLGHVQHAGRWVSLEESYRAQGYVQFEGSWITSAEREAILRQRTEQTLAERARAEAEARVREAEARARVAEAEARRAVAMERESEGGIPYGWVLAGGSCGFNCGPHPRPPQRPPAVQPLAEPPPPAPRPLPSPASRRATGAHASH